MLDAATQQSLLLGVPFILSIPAMAVWAKITQRRLAPRLIYAALAFIPGLLVVMFSSSFAAGMIGTCLLVLACRGG